MGPLPPVTIDLLFEAMFSTEAVCMPVGISKYILIEKNIHLKI